MPDTVLIDGVLSNNTCLDERALQFGDGLFETIAVVDHQPCLWKAHMQRLKCGCRQLHLPAPDVAQLRREVEALCIGTTRGVIKLYWTAGRSVRGYRRPQPLCPQRMMRLSEWPVRRLEPWHLRLCIHRVGDQPILAGIKHLNRLDQVIARSEWQDDTVDEGVMQGPDDRVVSGTMSNLFLQIGERLVTPSLDRAGIAGVVRQLMIEFASGGKYQVDIRDVTLKDLRQADAVYTSNSLIGVKRVARFDDVSYDLGIDEHPLVAQTRAACHIPDNTSGE